jgi:hypothetical protein
MVLMHFPDTEAGLRRVEAARYALLRRLALAMRDRMVAHLHPIGFATQVMERRLGRQPTDVERITDDMQRLRGFASEAVAVNLDVVTWIAPDTAQQVPLADGVRDCAEMLRGHFGFCGFDLRAPADGSRQPVLRAALRTVLPAVLFGLADGAPVPGDLRIACEGLAVQVELTPNATAVAANLPPYRLLPWDEVEGLAEAENVALTRTPTGARLQFRG